MVYLVLNTNFSLCLFQVNNNPEVRNKIYIDTLVWAVGRNPEGLCIHWKQL
jgi:hypothetical protein